MAKKTYIVITPLRLGAKDAIDDVAAGAVVELDEKIGEPLAAVDALVEQLGADKKAAK